jgi:hypothetical protein
MVLTMMGLITFKSVVASTRLDAQLRPWIPSVVIISVTY